MSKITQPHSMNWDLTSYFPKFDGPEMVQFKKSLKKEIEEILTIAVILDPLKEDNQAEWEKIFIRSENILTRLSHLKSYVGCLASTDACNEAYLREEARIVQISAEFSKLVVQLQRAIKETTKEIFKSFTTRKTFANARFFLERTRKEARHTMEPGKEALASDLGVDGIEAWGRLYDTLSSKLEFEMFFPDGRSERIPISQRRSLMEDSDRQVRRAAFEGGNAAWKTVEDVVAASLNAISGTRLSLNQYRGVSHFLDVALFQSSITDKTLNALFEAIYAELDLPQRILRLKAQAMGIEKIGWYDLGAPLPFPNQEIIPWVRGKNLVQTAFSRAYPALGKFTQEMYDRCWIDWEPRIGKRPGGFCTGSLLTRESRIFMTYNCKLGDIRTLAHEAGHAFHSYILRDLRPYARDYPMTLAESASTFAELVLTEGLLKDPSIELDQKARILDMEIGHGAIFLLDIPVRYEFEKSLYEERARGELSVSRLKDLMIETQQKIFGNVLQKGEEDPYFWASKLHFYITSLTFYNFPYTFGFLLSRGLFSIFQKEGPDFLAQYEKFLRNTGSDSVENVARKYLCCDLETPDFWVKAIQSLEIPLANLKKILPDVLPSVDTGE